MHDTGSSACCQSVQPQSSALARLSQPEVCSETRATLFAQALIASGVHNMSEGALPKEMQARILQVFADALAVPIASECLRLRSTLQTG
jgi:hypothetical protein